MDKKYRHEGRILTSNIYIDYVKQSVIVCARDWINIEKKKLNKVKQMAILTNNWIVDAVTFFIAALTVIYLLLKKNYSFWDRYGIKSVPNVSYIFGHFRETILQKEFIGDAVTRLYRTSNEPFVGIYTILRLILLVRDPELVQSILVKDFAHFTDRGVHCNEEYDPLSGNLFALPGQRWKNLRSKLTPTFTSGKLKVNNHF